MTVEVTTRQDDREVALLKAVGFDRLAPEQRELALAISRKYDLDPMLRHVVMIEGRLYVTRDGLLHVAHRSGQLDGITTTEPVSDGDYWRSSCSVYRKDMAHPFTYTGRYPTKGGNQKFAPEMATKVGEVAALRRAFDVAAPTAEERWDIDQSDLEPAPKAPTLAERVAEETAKIRPPAISAADFKAWYTESGISEEYAQGVARSLWPEQTGKLNDEQRAILKRRLEEAPDAEKLIADAFGS